MPQHLGSNDGSIGGLLAKPKKSLAINPNAASTAIGSVMKDGRFHHTKNHSISIGPAVATAKTHFFNNSMGMALVHNQKSSLNNNYLASELGGVPKVIGMLSPTYTIKSNEAKTARPKQPHGKNAGSGERANLLITPMSLAGNIQKLRLPHI